MKIIVLRKMEYNDVFIYVMQFSNVFQYLFAWNGEIYQNHTIIMPDWKRRFLSKIGLQPLYNKEQIEEGEKIILSGAIKTIDKLLLEYPSSGSRREKVFQREKKKNAKKKCLWQTRIIDKEKYWFCLTHGAIVKMEDGVKPHHK